MRNRSGLNFNKKRRKIEAAVVKEVFTWITGVFVAILLAFVLVYCVGMTTSVIGISMKPTLENSEKIYQLAIDKWYLFCYYIEALPDGGAKEKTSEKKFAEK